MKIKDLIEKLKSYDAELLLVARVMDEFGFPAFQVNIGLPMGRTEVFVSPGLSKATISELVPQEETGGWHLLKSSFKYGKQKPMNENLETKKSSLRKLKWLTLHN